MNEIIDKIAWHKSPLIPTIAQDFATKQVLMLAYSNKESLSLSLKSGVAHYFSRSKNRIWQKGEESGNTQKINEIYIDCDNDAILFLVNQHGNACHTGNISCFFKKIDLESLAFDSSECSDLAQKNANPYHIIDILYHILQERKTAPKDKSYTAQLYAKGENTICKKIIEESGEVTFAIKDFLASLRDDSHKSPNLSAVIAREQSDQSNPQINTCSATLTNPVDCHDLAFAKSRNDGVKTPADSLIYESADLLYHLLVGLSYCDISPDRVMSELKRRFGTSGIDEKNARKTP